MSRYKDIIHKRFIFLMIILFLMNVIKLDKLDENLSDYSFIFGD